MSITKNDLKNTLKTYHTSMKNMLNNKVDKVSGKGLSTNDYTTAEKTKLSGISTGANKYVHPSTHSISEISGLQGELDSLKQYASNGKTTIASAITGKGITTSSTATFSEMASNISNIPSGLDTSFVKQLIGLSIFNSLSKPNSAAIVRQIVLSSKYYDKYAYNAQEGDESSEDVVNDYGVIIGINADLYKISGTQIQYRDYGDVYFGYYTPGSVVETYDVIGTTWYQCSINHRILNEIIASGIIKSEYFE